MKHRSFQLLLLTLLVISSVAILLGVNPASPPPETRLDRTFYQEHDNGGLSGLDHPLSIEYLRQQEYPGSDLIVEQELTDGSNYSRMVVSYRSEGLKQFALLTLPHGEPPEGGWPAIVFNHGYIPPAQYRTTERYTDYLDSFARSGYVVIKPDYRGHGNSEGAATGGYGSPDYTIDVLNALASLQKHPLVNSDRIGMWGHSMGGHITQRAMVISPSIKAGVIWAGVVGSYPDLLEIWRPYWERQNQPSPTPNVDRATRRWRSSLVQEYGSPSDNPQFWQSISPTSFLDYLSGPIQLHHGTNDTSVPHQLSESLHQHLQTAGKDSELYIYADDDHNLTQNFSTAMRRSIEFFDQHLKLQ
jgi:uncharacterized protein